MCNLDSLVEPIDAPASDEDVVNWLTQQAGTTRPYILAFADDGIIWGRWENGQLLTANKVAASNDQSAHISPRLRGSTLHQAFIFGRESEVRLFKNETGQWQAREITDNNSDVPIMVESQILIGNRVINTLSGNFTHIQDMVQQGLDQILPIPITQNDFDSDRCARLTAHHYVEYDPESGEARIGLSRLVDIGVGPLHIDEVREDETP